MMYLVMYKRRPLSIPLRCRKIVRRIIPVRGASISQRCASVIKFIRRYTETNSYSPTYREIGEEVGISSTSVVSYYLNILEKEQLIERSRGKPRSIKVL